MNDKPILIVSGTGKTGRRVADRLQSKGAAVRIGSRSATPAFDWEKPATWLLALEGAASAYITYYPDLSMPGARKRSARSPGWRSRTASIGWCSCRGAVSRKRSAARMC